MNSKTIVVISLVLLFTLVLVEFIFIRFELFDYFPNIGIILHVFGGVLVSHFMYYIKYPHVNTVDKFVEFIYVIGSVAIACISWEVFEWILGFIFKRVFLGDLDNTIFDLIMGVTGGMIGYLILKTTKHFITIQK